MSLGYERVVVDPAQLKHLLVYLFDFVLPLMMLSLSGKQQPLYISSYDASDLSSDLQQRSWAHCLKRRISEWNPHVLGSSPSSLCDWNSVHCSSTTPSMSTQNSTARWATGWFCLVPGVPWQGQAWGTARVHWLVQAPVRLHSGHQVLAVVI